MQTPYKEVVDNFEELRSLGFKDLVELSPKTGLVCLSCGGHFEKTEATIGVHYLVNDPCIVSGYSFDLNLLFCPNCEPIPQKEGCVHLRSLIVPDAEIGSYFPLPDPEEIDKYLFN